MSIYVLKPIYSNQKSFYGKAIVEFSGKDRILWSYETPVAMVNVLDKTAKVWGTYSKTTLIHIKEFLKRYGFKADSKKQILEDYGV